VILGDLTAAHLGHVITFTHGGMTLTGRLDRVQHERHPWNSTRNMLKTTVALSDEAEWRHAETFSPFTACTVDPVDPPPRSTTPSPTQMNGM
jgi:hypothetical protein